jgi:hypothetical protein
MQVRGARINEGLSLKCALDHTVKNIAYVLRIQSFIRPKPEKLRCTELKVYVVLTSGKGTDWGALEQGAEGRK